MQRHVDPVAAFLAQSEMTLERLDSKLAACDRVIDVAWTLCDFAGRALELDDLIVYIADADGQGLTQFAAWGAKRKAERVFENPIRLRIGQGVVGTCLLTGEPQLVPDTRLDSRYVADDEVRLSELAVAMRAGGNVLGVLDTEARAAYAFDTPHVEAISLIADRAAARLLEIG